MKTAPLTGSGIARLAPRLLAEVIARSMGRFVTGDNDLAAAIVVGDFAYLTICGFLDTVLWSQAAQAQ